MVTLNKGQEAAFSNFLRLYKRGSGLTITGYAGSGKSVLLAEILKHCLGEHLRVAVAAYTHKACSVIREKLETAGIYCPVVTLHVLLGMEPCINEETGERSFISRNDNGDIDYQVVLVDECSYVPKDFYIKLNETFPNTIFVWFGDPAQLPPPGEERSPVFDLEEYNSHLSTVLRQQGPLLELATYIRENLFSRGLLGKVLSQCDGETIQSISRAAYTDAFSAHKQDGDDPIFLAFTNRTVDTESALLRYIYYGVRHQLPKIGEEMMLFDNTYLVSISEDRKKKFHYTIQGYNSEIIQVKGCRELKLTSILELPIPHYRISWEKDRGGVKVANWIEPSAKDELEDLLKEYAKNKRWSEYWAIKSYFHILKPPYALTVHKSQGSEYPVVFVDLKDLDKCKSVIDKNKLLYVACTRAKKKLYFITD